jgi:putative addiction module killer protein
MIEILTTTAYEKWLKKLKDRRARVFILVRLGRLELGNFGDVEPVGDGVNELRIHYGPGYRVYFKKRGDEIILLLCGGDKDTQQDDIKTAKRLAKEWSN